MRVHVADVVRGKFGVLDGSFHDTVSAVAILRGLRDVVGVAGHAVADDFSEDRRVALLRVFQRFQSQNPRTLAYDKSIASRVPRAAGASWIVVARRKRLHSRESA